MVEQVERFKFMKCSYSMIFTDCALRLFASWFIFTIELDDICFDGSCGGTDGFYYTYKTYDLRNKRIANLRDRTDLQTMQFVPQRLKLGLTRRSVLRFLRRCFAWCSYLFVRLQLRQYILIQFLETLFGKTHLRGHFRRLTDVSLWRRGTWCHLSPIFRRLVHWISMLHSLAVADVHEICDCQTIATRFGTTDHRESACNICTDAECKYSS